MNDYYQQLCSLNLDFKKSHLLLDLDALDSNIRFINQNSCGKKIRIATKSVRSVEIMKYIASKIHNFFGWMTYSTEEALWLRDLGFTNLLVGYPKWDKQSLHEIAQNSEHITLMIDDLNHLHELSAYRHQNSCFNICLDIDLSLNLS